jgi:hypothetical protein
LVTVSDRTSRALCAAVVCVALDAGARVVMPSRLTFSRVSFTVVLL